MTAQEGVEEDADNNNEDAPDDVVGDAEDKDQEPVERARKTSKYMTKYERARILGTRALQIRYFISTDFHVSISLFSLSALLFHYF